jgi:hypothetical protein
MATVVSFRNAAKATAFTVKPAMKAERITMTPVIEPSTNPPNTSYRFFHQQQALPFLVKLGTSLGELNHSALVDC